MRKLIFICTGNTCRSPLALAAWRALEQEGKTPPEIEADSAGLMTTEGQPAARHSREIAQSWHQDLSSHRSKMLSADEARNADWLVVMSILHAHSLREFIGVDADKILLLGALDQRESSEEIPDPYGGSREAYETCATHIQHAVERLAQVIATEAKV